MSTSQNNKKNEILITDTLFIFPEHEKKIKDAGYSIQRINKTMASEEELVNAIKGKVAYILGGIEKVTEKVIEAGSDLKVISFTGSDYRQFIPGYKLAFDKGIKITNTPGANSSAVAEFTILSILSMLRNFNELTRCGDLDFKTSDSMVSSTFGIIGMGYVGKKVVKILKSFGVKDIYYFSRKRDIEFENEFDLKFIELNDLLKKSDIISLSVSKEIGDNFISKKELSLIKDNSLIVNCGFTGGINKNALFDELKKGRLRAFQDDKFDSRFDELPKNIWNSSNMHTAYNTHQANKLASDMATNSVLNILKNKDDDFLVS